MSPDDLTRLKERSLRVRESVVRMSTGGGCFIGASLSCVDLLVYLYTRFLNITPDRTQSEDRDYFFLSKGHDVPALYGTLADMGFLEPERLRHHLRTSDSIYWHPHRSIPGVEFHSGSLGHLFSVAVGVAIDLKMAGRPNTVVVLVGDGELNEGSNWEAAMVAHAYKLDNLIVVVDRNGFQANVATEQLIPLEPLEYKFMAFGFSAETIDGHRFDDMESAFDQTRQRRGRPYVVVAETIRGKGLPSIENKADRWFCNFSEEEVSQLLRELHSNECADLQSETLVVR
jgi:transketolase